MAPQVTSSMTTTTTTALLTGRSSASLASPQLPVATPRTMARTQDAEHQRWLEELRLQYGHPAVAGKPVFGLREIGRVCGRARAPAAPSSVVGPPQHNFAHAHSLHMP